MALQLMAMYTRGKERVQSMAEELVRQETVWS